VRSHQFPGESERGTISDHVQPLSGTEPMRHTVIPAPARFDAAGGREFVFRPGTAVGYTNTGLAPMVERFCSQITRRTGLRLAPRAGRPVPDEPSVTIELAAGDDLRALPAPIGLSPAGGGPGGSGPADGGPGGGGPADERHSLVIDGDRVVVRAVEPVGVARGLTTLIQLLAAAPPGRAGEIRLPGTRILDAPRFAWRGLSLDVARRFFTVGEIRRVIDLLALYKLNVLHLHLTDDQSWPLWVGRPAGELEPGTAC
jgi:hexosaminidase